MAHVFRAIWTNHLQDIQGISENCFRNWLLARGTPVDFKENRLISAGEREVSYVTINKKGVVGTQFRMVEENASGGTWKTTLNAFAIEDRNIFWVDVDAEVEKVWQRAIAAPRLVRSLLLAGGEPILGSDTLEVQPREIDDDNSVAELLKGISNPDRRVPYLVIGAPSGKNRSLVMQIATKTTEILAGVAQVFFVNKDFIEKVNIGLANNLHIQQKSAQLLMPQVNQAPEELRNSERFEIETSAGTQEPIGILVARRIGISSLWTATPPEWHKVKSDLDEKRKRLDRPSTNLAKVSKSDKQVDLISEDLGRLAAQIEDLQNQLLDAQTLAQEWYEYATGLEEKAVGVLVSNRSNVGVAKSTIAATVSEVRRFSKFVVIPNEALQEIDQLDTLIASEVWAGDIIRLFASFEAYGMAKSFGEFRGGYFQWAKKKGDYPSTKIAMTESESTRRSSELRDSRTFPIDTAVKESGQIEMFAHAKIQAKGSSQIPRVFFHDDTNGKTGKIHVGFIGPHSVVPTSNWG